MRLLILAATLALPGSSIAQPAPGPTKAIGTAPDGRKLDCIANRVHHAQKRDTSRAQRLDELPAGTVYLSVMRQVNGCEIPVLASEERARRR